MAIQNRSLVASEHDWYATRSGLPNSATLTEHKAQYFSYKGFGSNASVFKPVTQMESDWLNSVGGRANEGAYDQWSAACEAQSVTPGKTVDDCKMRFFTSVASGTNP